jgi:hypothetical protein
MTSTFTLEYWKGSFYYVGCLPYAQLSYMYIGSKTGGSSELPLLMKVEFEWKTQYEIIKGS